MLLTHDASGNIMVAGCAKFNFKRKYETLFSLGSKVYIKRNAMFGKIEYVVIKKINKHFPNNSEELGIKPEIMYVDTNNRVWAEEELILQGQATIMAGEYWEKMRKISHDLFKNCLPIGS